MIGRNSVILDAAEAAVLLRDLLGLLLLRPCPSQPFVEEYANEEGAAQARAAEMPETRGIWEGVPAGEKLWHVRYPGHDGGGHGIYETEAEMLDEYRPVMLGRHPPHGAVLDVREPWQYSVFTENGYRYASRDDTAGRWNSPTLMPRAAVQMRARVVDVDIIDLWSLSGAICDRDPLLPLIQERHRRDMPVRESAWWDSRSFARKDRGTLHDQNPYVYTTRLIIERTS